MERDLSGFRSFCLRGYLRAGVEGELKGFLEGWDGGSVVELEDHLGLEPGVGGGVGDLVVVDVEVLFDVLALRYGGSLVVLDVFKVLDDVLEKFLVGFVPEGHSDAIGSVLVVVGHAVFVLVEACLGPVAHLVDEDPVVDSGFELAMGVFEGGVGAGEAIESGFFLGGELLPEGGGEGVGFDVVVGQGLDVLKDELGRCDGAGGACVG